MEKSMYNIYIIKNKINNKIYIGQTKASIEKRWSGHKSRCNNGSKLAIHAAMRLYGIENFFIELLDTAFDLPDANKKEIKMINDYNSKCPNGYNMVDGGSTEFLNACLPKTSEHKNKIRSKHAKNAKPIIQFDIETGQLIKEWESGKQLMRAGYKRANIITLCKRAKRFGYIYGNGWCYKEFYESTLDKSSLSTPNYNPHGSTIKCLDKKGNLIKIYYKILDAAKELGCNPSSIADCLTGRAKSCKGYKWEYIYSQNLQLQ
jgi:group I intron endonuclease